MKNKIILNIPHSSLKLSKEFIKKKKLLNMNEIEKFNLQMTDLFTDKLFSFKKFSHIKAKCSRICCDVEKFVDDRKEVMAQFGLGVIYKNDLNKRKIFLNLDKAYQDEILNKYYFPYHKKLDHIVGNCLKKQKVILIDCHSFSKEIVMDDALKNNLPDICIGYDPKFCSNELMDFVCQYFKSNRYSVQINYPYFGTMVPDFLFEKADANFQSVMIEINRKIYLTKNRRNKNYNILKKQLKMLLKKLQYFKLQQSNSKN